MQEIKGLVSIIVPVYNTGTILNETVESVIGQTYSNFELILIDDGSTNDTIGTVDHKDDRRITILRQHNQGMAQTRNNGLSRAKGEFVLFLDHDDVLAPDFLAERVCCLVENPDIGFVGGPIRTFPENPKDFFAAANDVENEILFFSPKHLTTPSSYVIRHRVLRDHGIGFNTSLNSTADKFFLLQMNKVTNGRCLPNGRLNYRVSARGFSSNFTPAYMKDNEQLLIEIKKSGLTPKCRTRYFRCLYNYMLAGGYGKIGYYSKAMMFAVKSLFWSPVGFFDRIWSKRIEN